jgi:hypothetical protein
VGPIEACNVEMGEALVCSFAQSRLWILNEMSGGKSSEYNMPDLMELRGDLDVDKFRACLRNIVDRHVILRTVYKAFDDVPHQIVRETDEMFAMPIIDLSDLTDDEAKQTKLNELSSADASMPSILLRAQYSDVHWLN